MESIIYKGRMLSAYPTPVFWQIAKFIPLECTGDKFHLVKQFLDLRKY